MSMVVIRVLLIRVNLFNSPNKAQEYDEEVVPRTGEIVYISWSYGPVLDVKIVSDGFTLEVKFTHPVFIALVLSIHKEDLDNCCI